MASKHGYHGHGDDQQHHHQQQQQSPEAVIPTQAMPVQYTPYAPHSTETLAHLYLEAQVELNQYVLVLVCTGASLYQN
jgi:hypothetical protein